MIPSFLITFREVLEASLIVATILGILVKLKQTRNIKTVWWATASAAALSVILLSFGSLLGTKVQEVYAGKTEELIEGVLMVVSAMFITWAVFFLHTYFGRYKTQLLSTIRATVERQEKRALFGLVFTTVFREGFEIVLFLSTIYFSSDPQHIFAGFLMGAALALAVSLGLFTATVKMPVFYAFRATTILLILFAGGLLARGVHEFMEAGLLTYPSMLPKFTIPFLPAKTTLLGQTIKAVFGLTRTMHSLELLPYLSYIWFMHWWVFTKNKNTRTIEVG